MIKASEYQNRREKLLSKMDDGSVAIIFSGVEKVSSADEFYPFEVNRNFYYLTGIDQPDSVLVLAKSEGDGKAYLFVSPFDPIKEKWYGKRLTLDEARAISGINNVLINSTLNAKIASIAAENGDYKTIYLDLEKEIKITDCTSTNEYAKTIQLQFKNSEIKDIYKDIVALRMVKSKDEIAEMMEAIKTTKLGVQAVMAKARPGIKEYELADEFHHVINDDSGYQGVAFNTIMASGKNATCLHYPNPQGTIDNGVLLLMDLGSRNNYYNADVSRTIPVNGKFNELQLALYQIVLGANKAVAKFARPGVTIMELQSLVKEYMSSELISKGLIKTKEELDEFYYHNVSHHIGLDTHDPGSRTEPLVEGNVISDEPGLYFAKYGIGIRIEDDLLITKDGATVLTADIIKEVDDIEKFYSKR